ncbi:4097_t:CDS:10 [Ambispora gerdemannii]|uniref:Glutamate--tRNA ligase, mitochondrial n=1 Tax=Ambispora gerdemannii TaxID=144530 RepID=A0A9N9BF78_9GLOM|nr:4097_t:CDS:10 [Ambispora gerdemannii]
MLLNCENLLKPIKSSLHTVKVPWLKFQKKLYIHSLIQPNKPVRVRFAPSPTGSLHLGGLRTALFNYLIARKTGGSFVLRIEDTDRKRHVPGAVENILTCLQWAGLDFDEGPGKDSPYGPFYQSERTELYRNYALKLIKERLAYRCFCTPERLNRVREIAQKSGTTVLYDRHCLSIDSAAIEENLAIGMPHTIRLKTPEGAIKFNDLIYGLIEVSDKNIDDAILLKSDGYPTYHLANVVDDHLMKITHVLRGEEWLPSTPKHIILYKSLGWEPPQFVHLPLLLNSDKTKLSKRSGNVRVEDFVRNGYLPEAVLNFVAFLGWCPPDNDKEIFTLGELILEFSPDQIGHSGATLLISKLDWMNKAHLKRKMGSTEGLKELVKSLKPLIQEKFSDELTTRGESWKLDNEYLSKVILTIGDRTRKISDIPELCGYFFISPDYDSSDSLALRAKIGENNLRIVTKAVAYCLKDLNTDERNNLDSLKLCIDNVVRETGKKRDEVLMALRYILTGIKIGAGVAETMCTLGNKTYMERINFFVNKFSE